MPEPTLLPLTQCVAHTSLGQAAGYYGAQYIGQHAYKGTYVDLCAGAIDYVKRELKIVFDANAKGPHNVAQQASDCQQLRRLGMPKNKEIIIECIKLNRNQLT